ncbi:hypothetical protein REMIM1_PE00374 (plasmid) [Rhizobium etli bv. mimosae str. Mim1]|nr:hypothetical protein REMIM1_PE00374 [Rhizobium etli bv. mimosae str. Mim1]
MKHDLSPSGAITASTVQRPTRSPVLSPSHIKARRTYMRLPNMVVAPTGQMIFRKADRRIGMASAYLYVENFTTEEIAVKTAGMPLLRMIDSKTAAVPPRSTFER